jgi:hypothetical protein
MGLIYEDDRVTSFGGDKEYHSSSSNSSSMKQLGLALSSHERPKPQDHDTEKLLERVRFHSAAYLDQWLKKSWCTLYRSARRYRPSVVAISCVLAARRTLGLVPILSERLKEMALLEECYSEAVYEEIGDCYEVVCNLGNKGRKRN